jgi:hypothetical protein
MHMETISEVDLTAYIHYVVKDTEVKYLLHDTSIPSILHTLRGKGYGGKIIIV